MGSVDVLKRPHDYSTMENIYRIKKQYYDLICKLCNLYIEKEGVEKLYKFISFDSNEKLNKSKIETFGTTCDKWISSES